MPEQILKPQSHNDSSRRRLYCFKLVGWCYGDMDGWSSYIFYSGKIEAPVSRAAQRQVRLSHMSLAAEIQRDTNEKKYERKLVH
ncbi:hypothetical protein B0H12DRAFT_1158728, partial [Mycena haematopus]